MSHEKTHPTPPITAARLLTLDYQRLERARKVAIGGLRLLGVLLSILAMISFLILANQIHSMRPGSVRRAILPLSIMAIVFILGMAKFTCSLFIARRSRTAASIALIIVLIECLGMLCLFIGIAIHLLEDAGEPFAYSLFLMSLPVFVLLGWLAVGYEIIQILRLDKSTSPS